MICAVILAAGEGRRMGEQKMLLPFAGSAQKEMPPKGGVVAYACF